MDVQVSVHTDTQNEGSSRTRSPPSMAALHTFHSEGAGGGHAPDILRVTGEANVLPSSTDPTLPYGLNTAGELSDMIMVVHNLNPRVPSDVAFTESRIRAETMTAENFLHDLGAISMFSSDSQAMGRVGANWLRTMQTADAMKRVRGKLAQDAAGNDNFRVLRYVAKITINPALTSGTARVVGSVEPGKMADLVLWEPAFFGAKPKLVIKGGLINWGLMGDVNASVPTAESVRYRPMFGSFDSALARTCVSFVSAAAYEAGVAERLELRRQVRPVERTRTITKRDLVRNSALPAIKVDPRRSR
jgi:urease subunit alpha